MQEVLKHLLMLEIWASFTTNSCICPTYRKNGTQ